MMSSGILASWGHEASTQSFWFRTDKGCSPSPQDLQGAEEEEEACGGTAIVQRGSGAGGNGVSGAAAVASAAILSGMPVKAETLRYVSAVATFAHTLVLFQIRQKHMLTPCRVAVATDTSEVKVREGILR